MPGLKKQFVIRLNLIKFIIDDSYSQYEPLYQTYKYDGIFSCDCSANQVSWSRITNSVEVTDDGFCDGFICI